ncbi:hypothetical protein [Brevibacterium sp. CS2]|uniref:hypothetical protein n=1 Tax=Brevibacterium sp. CS2 TaxID=2575923 RepID=UPI0010C7CA0D|nr:hypothetical protein [Brevibacterium sp. CS2]QCP04618.1 hypothetical protein FDF13_04370 [Brevibacterium sp. CS2]
MSHGVSTHGGPGGTRARTEDLADFAAELRGNAEEVAELFLRSAGSELDPVLELSAVTAPTTAFEVSRRSTEFLGAAAGVSGRLAGTGTALGAAVLAYRAAEDFAASLFDRVLTAMGNVLGHAVRTAIPLLAPVLVRGLVTVGVVLAIADRIGLDELLENAFGIDLPEVTAAGLAVLGRELFAGSDGAARIIEHVLPGFVAGFLGVPPGLQAQFGDRGPWPHDSQSVTEWVIAGGRAGGLMRRTGVDVAHTERSPGRRPARAPAGLPELFARTLAGHRGRDNGRVQIERIRGADGAVRWIVYVPATTDWSARTGKNSTDLTTNVEGVAGHDTAMRETVRQAVAEAGIGADEEVMLVGYSQGGITAASLAADPAFRNSVSVTALLTVASPVSDFDIPDGISTLSIEHEQDLVPDLDGGENPDRPHWTTITVDLDTDALRDDELSAGRTEDQIDEVLANPGFAHGGDVYAATIDRLHREGEPGLLAWQDSRAGFFSGEVESVQDSVGTRR